MNEICSTCGLPKDLCVCETIAKEMQSIKVKVIKKKFGKVYTVIEGVDPKQIDIKDLTKKLNTDFGLTVIMVLHDLNLASEYCRKLLLINKGRIHKMGLGLPY